MMKKSWVVAVVGATGAVGRELLSLLKERHFPVGELRLFASGRSAGRQISFDGQAITVQALSSGCFDGVDFAFFDASDAVSTEWAPQAAESGAWVIDNSAAFRMHEGTSLVVPEVNPERLRMLAQKGRNAISAQDRLIAGPNCSTVQLVVALKPIAEKWGLKRVVVSTYQSVSGAGSIAMDELSEQTAAVLNTGHPTPSHVFAHRIAFNCIPQIGGAKENGYTSEEQKVILESRKILGLPGLRVTATAIRVPTFSCHAESVNVETLHPFDLQEVRRSLESMPGIIVQDDSLHHVYPMNVTSPGDAVEGASGRDAVYVGRLRRDESVENGLNLWVVSDNLRKGAALNAIQISELILQNSPQS